MKTIIAGSRSIKCYKIVKEAIEKSGFEITEIVSGTAYGVDKLGEKYALENDIPIKSFPANWSKYGKKAGVLRNYEMAEYADAVILVWDGFSRGTRHMYNIAKSKNLKIFLFIGEIGACFE